MVLFAALALGACSSGGDTAAPTTIPPTSSTDAPETTAAAAQTTEVAYVLPRDVADQLAACVDGAIRQLDDTGVECVAAKVALMEQPLSKVNGVINALDDLTAMVVQRETGVKDWPATAVVNQAREVQARVDALA